jgi:CheY-like chemotaxis protein
MKKRILIVEDEAIVAKSLTICLKMSGYDVLEAVSTGEDALESAKKNNPDLILMDIRLRGPLNGYQIMTKIRSHSDIPVVYTTAGNPDEINEEAKDTKPYDYILKPFDHSELLCKIEKMVFRI